MLFPTLVQLTDSKLLLYGTSRYSFSERLYLAAMGSILSSSFFVPPASVYERRIVHASGKACLNNWSCHEICTICMCLSLEYCCQHSESRVLVYSTCNPSVRCSVSAWDGLGAQVHGWKDDSNWTFFSPPPLDMHLCEHSLQSLSLLFYLTEGLFMDCLINWEEVTWEIVKPRGVPAEA